MHYHIRPENENITKQYIYTYVILHNVMFKSISAGKNFKNYKNSATNILKFLDLAHSQKILLKVSHYTVVSALSQFRLSLVNLSNVLSCICFAHNTNSRHCYPCAVCARVMRLCPSVYVRTYMCVCVSSKNTPVCVLPLENLHENTLCSFFTEFIVL